ncbi:RICIN domain-containing protein [Nocardia sp. NBC_01503]|uniref:RICIN domain-containing protein n=1 Tax=Nocardia sp. NBC_01503 TaxID=2975997 RepID=UPI002E7BA3E6|nr:RICIN domain-containing protein [Nocardia sp. NBC_01503]WTL29318.1 RICIN domain-containing protein [Nocardia sp. NBC_01503]
MTHFITRAKAGLFFGALTAVGMVIAPATANAAQPDDVVTIQQVSSGRYLDAWNDRTHDYNVVTRPKQGDVSQQWRIHWDDSGTGTGTVEQVSSHRYLDAHEIESLDYHLVTRPVQNNPTQQWRIQSIGGGKYTMQQVSSNRYVDAHEIPEKDYGVVSRPAQNNTTQQFVLTVVGH